MKLLLEFNGYQVHTAYNGKQALKVLSSLNNPPDLIISDIMMPEMNGYDLLQKVSQNPKWSLIPFIFVTAKSSPEDVRFGKILGADDYITKPFEEEDLLASVTGKIAKAKIINKFSRSIEKKLVKSLKIDLDDFNQLRKENETCLFLMQWDESIGPKLECQFPESPDFSYSIEEIGVQLFQTTVSIYGNTNYDAAEGVLLKIANIQMDGYIYFDSFDDSEVRGGKRQFMITFIAPRINYLESLRIKEIVEEFAIEVRNRKDYTIKKSWQKISKMLSTPILEIK